MSRVLILSLVQQQTENAVTGAGVHGVCQVCFIKERFQDVCLKYDLYEYNLAGMMEKEK